MDFIYFINENKYIEKILKEMKDNISSVDLNNKDHQLLSLMDEEIIKERLINNIKTIEEKNEISLYTLIIFYREIIFINNSEIVDDSSEISKYSNILYEKIINNNIKLDEQVIDIESVLNIFDASSFEKDCLYINRLNKSLISIFSKYIEKIYKEGNINKIKIMSKKINCFFEDYNCCLTDYYLHDLVYETDKKYLHVDESNSGFTLFRPMICEDYKGEIINKLFYDIIINLEKKYFRVNV